MRLWLVGAALLLVTDWLGGELVNRLRIGVDERAQVDASNSVSEHGVVEPTASDKRAARARPSRKRARMRQLSGTGSIGGCFP